MSARNCSLRRGRRHRRTEMASTTAESPPSTSKMENGPHSSYIRKFSWSCWLLVAVALGTLLSYFRRRIPQAYAASIAPTKILDARFGFTPSQALQTLQDLGPEG